MRNLTLIAAAVTTTLGWSQSGPVPTPQLKEEAIVIEYCATNGEAALVVEAEAERPLEHVLVRDDAGATLLRLQTRTGLGMELAGFQVQSAEAPLAEILAAHPEGTYRMFARTGAGQVALGEAVLSHTLPEAPRITYPEEGQAMVPTGDFEVTWIADPQVEKYRIGLEQGETDGIAAVLPKGTGSFRVPAGVLQSATETHLEVIAVGVNGNLTGVELSFTTR